MKPPELLAPYRTFAEKHELEILPGEVLDHYLAHGWYRMGQSIFTTHFLSYEQDVFSAIWIRLELPGYRFRKSLRKLLRKNREQYTVDIHPANITAECERLFRKYKKNFPGRLSPSLEYFLLDDYEEDVFNTWQVSVRRNGKLCAASFFDLGKESAESIVGIYDPDYKEDSLGFFTMVLEMEFCQKMGLRFFYPGYVVPGNPRFDYKLRIGKPAEITYYDLSTLDWQTYTDFSPDHSPLAVMKRSLQALAHRLRASGLDCSVLFNPIFEINLIPFIDMHPEETYLDYPILLYLSNTQQKNQIQVVVFDPRNASFKLMNCMVSLHLWFHFHQFLEDNFDKSKYLLLPLAIRSVSLETTREEKVLQFLQ